MMVLRPPSPYVPVIGFRPSQPHLGSRSSRGCRVSALYLERIPGIVRSIQQAPQLLAPDARQPCNRPNCSAINVNVAKSSVFTILIIDADAKPRWQLTGLF